LLWSDFPEVSFKRWTKAIGDLLMVLIVLSERDPLASLQRLLSRTAFVLIPLSVLLIKYYPNLGRAYGIWQGEAYYVGVTINKNTLGAICLCLGLGALWRLLSAYRDRELAGRSRKMIAQVLVLVMALWLFKMAHSMTALSCFMMGGVLLIATNLRFVIRRPVLAHGLIAAMLLVSASVLFLDFSPTALKTLGKDPSLTGRTEVWGTLLSLDRSPVLGTGFESFWLGPRLDALWTKYWWHPNEAHDGYLEVYLNVGWVGIALLGVVLVTSYRAVFRAWRNRVPAGSLCLTYCFVGLAYNFTEAAFFKMLAPVWLFFLLAVVSASAISHKSRKLVRSQAHRRLSREPGWGELRDQPVALERIAP
jgi:exopolysaccharide production protein ExoQ